MNTGEIEKALEHCRPAFVGVYSRDTLPKTGSGLMVVNTDPKDRPGTYWIVLKMDDECGEYFDPLGRKPDAIFSNYLDRRCKRWIWNERQLQSVASRFCGHYCVYYCMLSCRGIDLIGIVNNFTDDTGFNDVLVHGFVCRNRK